MSDRFRRCVDEGLVNSHSGFEYVASQTRRRGIEPCAWYGNHRSKQASSFAMRDEKGAVSRLSLPATIALGSW